MINEVKLEGRLTEDPKKALLIHTADGDKYKYVFTVASQSDFGKKATSFIPCAAWGRTGEFVQKWFKKGNLIVLKGRLTSHKDLEKEVTIVELTADRVEFPSRAKSDPEEYIPPIEAVDEDLPF